jgi:hypothetical protein
MSKLVWLQAANWRQGAIIKSFLADQKTDNHTFIFTVEQMKEKLQQLQFYKNI